VWAFQTVHHDLWDYDIAAQPALVEFAHDGRRVAAVVQATKTGMVFVLDRETGAPIFPIEERAVPQSDVPGEQASPTQPFSTLPSFMPHGPVSANDVFGLDDTERQACRAAGTANNLRPGGLYTPPSLRGTVMFPGNGAGTNWGSVSFHPGRSYLILNTTRIATYVQLMTREDFDRTIVNDRQPGFEYGRMRGSRYGMRRATLLSPRGLPCNPMPWGTLAALDLSTGTVAWEIPFGDTPDRYGIPPSIASEMKGWPNSGGSIVTAGGVIFIGATMDQKFRAFDVASGQELWKTDLPRAGIATPMTYAVDGKQYVVIAAGGHGKWGLEQGDYVIAFALPDSR
jgi:quinoprotein glucose dehydrogenase